MNYSNVCAVGNKVKLVKATAADGRYEPKKYISKVIDFMGDDKTVIAMPVENGKVIPLSVGEKYICFFYTEVGTYQCKCEIVDRFKKNDTYVMIIQFISAFERCRRRHYFRLDIIKEIEFRFVTGQEKLIAQKISEDNFDMEIIKNKYINQLNLLQSEWNKGTATNISGGGMRFNANADKRNEKDIVVKINFTVGNKVCNYMLNGNIIAITHISSKPGFYDYHIRFSDMSKEERENIIKYIFEEERRRRKRDLR